MKYKPLLKMRSIRRSVHSSLIDKKSVFSPILQTFWVNLNRKSKYCQRFLSAIKQRQILAAYSFSTFKKRQHRPSISAVKQRQILFALSFMLSSRGRYWPRFLLRYQAQAKTVRAFFFRFQDEAIQAERFFLLLFFWGFFSYYIQHCFVCRPSDSPVPTDAGIEPRTVATGALAVSYCPAKTNTISRFLVWHQAETNTGRAFFFPSSSESCR